MEKSEGRRCKASRIEKYVRNSEATTSLAAVVRAQCHRCIASDRCAATNMPSLDCSGSHRCTPRMMRWITALIIKELKASICLVSSCHGSPCGTAPDHDVTRAATAPRQSRCPHTACVESATLERHEIESTGGADPKCGLQAPACGQGRVANPGGHHFAFGLRFLVPYRRG